MPEALPIPCLTWLVTPVYLMAQGPGNCTSLALELNQQVTLEIYAVTHAQQIIAESCSS